MIRVACWTCVLWALADAVVLDRCELASELRALGVDREHISTWVCIAYHESRLDTAAYNPHSGDHGIFQISQLYWCGPGKACGVPCSAFRDEDISDDVECALRIREEHSRFQGDGFLAWVVYPQHCKQNTKKYIVDCDNDLRYAQVKTASKSRIVSSYDEDNATFAYNPNIDNLKPPYFAINSFLQGGFSKVLQQTDYNNEPINWYNFKVDNIDELTLPVLHGDGVRLAPIPTTTTATTTAARPRTTFTSSSSSINQLQIGSWHTPWGKKYVETKQFRKMHYKDEREKPSESRNATPKYTNYTPFVVTSTSKPTIKTTTTQFPTRIASTAKLINYYPSTKIASIPTQSFITTSKPATSNWSIWLTSKPTTLSTTTSRPVSSTTTTRKPVTTSIPINKSNWVTTSTTIKSTWSTTTSKPNTTSTSRPIWNSATTRKPTPSTNVANNAFASTATTNKSAWITTTTNKPFWRLTATTTRKPDVASTFMPIWNSVTTRKQISSTAASATSKHSTISTTTSKPNTISSSKFTWNSVTTRKPVTSTFTTSKPAITKIATPKPIWNSFTTRIPVSSAKTTEKYNWSAFGANKQSSSTIATRRPATSSPVTTKVFTYKPAVVSSTTPTPRTTTQRYNYFSSTTASTFPRFNSISSTTSKPLFTKPSLPINSTVSKPDSFAKFSLTTPRTTTRESLKRSSTTVWPLLFSTSNALSNKLPATDKSTKQIISTFDNQPKTTQSIFDLYLNPSRTTKMWTLKFKEFSTGASKLKIFAEGTTTPASKAALDSGDHS